MNPEQHQKKLEIELYEYIAIAIHRTKTHRGSYIFQTEYPNKQQ